MPIHLLPPRKLDASEPWLLRLFRMTTSDIIRLSNESHLPEPGTWWGIQKNQKLAEQFWKDSSRISSKLPVLGFPRKSGACSRLFTHQLNTVRANPSRYQAALLACIHLLPAYDARSHILSLRPAPEARPFDYKQLPVFLSTIMMARQANPSVCTQAEADAAAELLSVDLWPGVGDFPSITRLLKAVGEFTCDILLPLPLVRHVLTTRQYQEAAPRQLDILRAQCRWYEAERMVRGLDAVLALPRVASMARDFFPDHEVWAAWKPHQHRIEQWGGDRLDPYRAALIPLLELEGPDWMTRCEKTLAIAKFGSRYNETHMGSLCERSLRLLDRCINVGPGTVELLIALTADEPIPFPDSTHALISAVVDIHHDSASAALAAFTLARPTLFTNEICPIAQMQHFYAIIPIFTCHPHLRRQFITPSDLAQQAAHALRLGALQLPDTTRPSRLIAAIDNLVAVLLAAEWLHGSGPWPDSFVPMLETASVTSVAWGGTTAPPYIAWLAKTIANGVVGLPELSSPPDRKPPPSAVIAPRVLKVKLHDRSQLPQCPVCDGTKSAPWAESSCDTCGWDEEARPKTMVVHRGWRGKPEVYTMFVNPGRDATRKGGPESSRRVAGTISPWRSR